MVCRGVLQEMESVVTRARHFQFKPDGDVTFMMAQDAVGLPAPLMQVSSPLDNSTCLCPFCSMVATAGGSAKQFLKLVE